MSRTRARLALLAVALAGLTPAASAGPEPPRPLSRDWKRLASPNFVVAGNASERQLRSALLELENFRRVFLTLWPDLSLEPATPTVLVLFRDSASFGRFNPRNERGHRVAVGGYFLPQDDVNYMAAPASVDRAATFEVIFHEYTHYILHRASGPLPRWANEGLAEFYSTFEMEGRDRSILGRPPRAAWRTIRREPLLPFDRILTSEGAAKTLRTGADVRRFYAQAWALVHYSMVGRRKGQLASYLRALERGLSVEQAFADAYRVSFAALQEELRSYVALLQLPAVSVTVPGEAPKAEVTAERMPEADALALQGDLLMRLGSDQDAEPLLNKALQIDARHVGARVALAGVMRHRDRPDRSMELLQAVAAEAPRDFAAHYWLGLDYLTAGRYQDALNAWVRSLEINDRSRDAWVELSIAALALGRTAQARAAFARARALDRDPALYQRRAYRMFEIGLHATIPSEVAAFIRDAGAGNESAPYMAFLGALAYRRLRDEAAAEALLAHTAAALPPDSWAGAVTAFLRGRLDSASLLEKARDVGERTEAHAYVGVAAAIAGRLDQAVSHLTWVVEQGSRQYTEYHLARAELRRVRAQASEPRTR